MNILKKYLTKPKSPLNKAPQNIQEIFENLWKYNLLIIPIIFPLAPSKTNKCTKILKSGDLYYECIQCVSDNNFRSCPLYFCANCFIQSKHQGHFYKTQIVTSQQKILLCSCGRYLDRQNPVINYCEHHVEEQIDIEIPELKYIEFKNYFKPLYEIILYLTEVVLEEEQNERQFKNELKRIFQTLNVVLIQLTNNSILYIRMWTDMILEQKISTQYIPQDQSPIHQFAQKQFAIFQFILAFKGLTQHECQQVFFNIFSDTLSTLKFLPAFNDYSLITDQISVNERFIIEMNYVDSRIMEKLASEGKYLNFLLQPPYTNYIHEKTLSSIIMNMISNLVSKKNNKTINIIANYLHKNQLFNLNQQDNLFLIKYFTDLYIQDKDASQKSKKQSVPLNKEQFKKDSSENQQPNRSEQNLPLESNQNENENGNIIPQDNIQQIHSNDQPKDQQNNLQSELQSDEDLQISIYSQVIGQQIYALFKGECISIMGSRKYLEENGINMNAIQIFLEWSIDNIDFGGSLQLIPSRFVITSILLMAQSPNSQKLLEVFWTSIFIQNDMDQILKNVWSLIFLLTDKILLRWSNRQVCFKETADLMLKDQHLQVTNQIIEQVNEMQLQYMHEFKQIPQRQLAQLRVILNNRKFGVLAQHYTQYNRQENVFTYKSTENHQNKMIILLKALRTLKSNKVKKFMYHQQRQTYSKMLPKKDQERNFRKILFIQSQFLSKIEDMWAKVIFDLNDKEDRIDNFRQNKSLESYLQVLVIINNLCEGNFSQLQKYLDSVRTDKDKLAEFYILGNIEEINQILSIKEEFSLGTGQGTDSNHKKEVNNSQTTYLCDPELKKKSDLKKSRLIKKFKETRKKAVQNLSTNSLSLVAGVSLEEEEQCLICHEKSKSGNQMVYMMDIVKQSTLCSGIFGQKNSAKTFLTSCFHSIHVNCFITSKGSNKYLRCPLCSKPQNCIFPINFTKNNKLNIICENIMKVSVIGIYGVFDVGDWFLMFLSYLVEAKAIHSLMNIKQYDQRKKKRQKIDFFVQSMLEQMYENNSEIQKNFYHESIELLQEKINQCPDEDFKTIQKLMFDALVSKIKSGQSLIDMPQLHQLERTINQNQMLVIRNQIEEIGHKPLESCPSINSQPQKSLAFSLKNLPETWDKLPKLGGQKCTYCGSLQKALFCLICGETICRKCEQSQAHQKKHCTRSMSFLFHESTLSLRTQSSRVQSDIYFNELQTSIRKWDESCSAFDTFRLDQKCLDNLSKMFMEDI